MTIQEATSIRIDKDVVFGRGGDADLRLDVYHPSAEASKHTAVIQLHGGGFTRGARENIAANCRAFAARGYTAIAAQYRLVDAAPWPAQIEDVKAAIRWTRANLASLDVEEDKIAIAGYSAGAILALIAAGSSTADFEGNGGNEGVSSAVSACLAFYPADVLAAGHVLIASGGPEARTQTSPLTYAGKGSPPTLLFHATGDITLPFEGSVRLFEALRAAGVPAELHLFEGLSHVFDRHPEFAAPAIELCDLFLDRHVVEPRVYPPFTPGAARPG